MTVVVPGQYLVPEYKSEGLNKQEICRYLPGKGAVLSYINAGPKRIPVIVATVVGHQIVQEIRSQVEELDEPKDYQYFKHPRIFLVSVVSGRQNQYAKYASEIDASASDSVNATATNLPREGDVVLVHVTRINLKQAFCELLSVEGFGNASSDGGQGSNGNIAHLSVPSGGGSQILSSYGAISSTQSSMTGAQPFDIGEAFKAVLRSQDVRSTDRDKVKIVECFKPGDLVRAQVLSLGDGSNYYLTTARNDLGVVFAKSEGGAGGPMTAIDWETMVCEQTGVTEHRKCAKLFS